MIKTQSKTNFVDLKFFLGLLFLIYGTLLVATGIYYTLNPVLGLSQTIDLYWGLVMFGIGAVVYYKSDKPSSWNKAFAIAGIERIERRMKKMVEDVEREI